MNNSRRYIVSLSTIIILAAVTFILIIKGNTPVYNVETEYKITDDTIADKIIETSVFQIGEGWGYDIYVDGKRYIHQPIMPVVQGNKAFVNEADAREVAEFVAGKIRKNSIPPTISYEELDSLGVQK